MKEDKGRAVGKVERVAANISWREDNGILKKKKSKLIATTTIFPYSGFRYVVSFCLVRGKKEKEETASIQGDTEGDRGWIFAVGQTDS